jgi:hypothetical protein
MGSQTGAYKAGFLLIPGYTGMAWVVFFEGRRDKKTIHDKISPAVA